MNKPLSHGGDWAGFKEKYGYEPLDYSSNVNPLGIPGKVSAAIKASVDDVQKYPDPLCRELTHRISEYENLDEQYIICGAGASDIIHRIALAVRPERVLLTAPGFGGYEEALRIIGSEISYYSLREEYGFEIRDDYMSYLDGVDMVFLCEPNNPTGVTTDRNLLSRIIKACRKHGTYVVFDECFVDMLDEPETHTMKSEIGEYDRLIILKAFTKNFAIPGLRLGYALCSNEELLNEMFECGQSWAVSVVAQAAGIAALDEDTYLGKGRETIRSERAYLREELVKMGINDAYGEANYLFFRASDKLAEELMKRGIMIRDCSNYKGLGAGWYRIAVRLHEENEILIHRMKECING